MCIRDSKECAYELQLSTGTVKIGAMAKGSGMIHPNMATMLVYVTVSYTHLDVYKRQVQHGA